MKRTVCALLAHVDAGKTTLSEAMLFTAGVLRRQGRVDHKDAFLDTDAQERQRGITIFSKQARLNWKDCEIILTDTPGHVDFAGETERVLTVADMAVLVLSGPDGIQAHTLTLWRLLERYRVPAVIFINKLDQPGVDIPKIVQTLQRRLSEGCILSGTDKTAEEIAALDENALNEWLEHGRVSAQSTERLFAQRKYFPVLTGSALKNNGVDRLLDTVGALAPSPVYPDAFAARVYKIARDSQGNRLTFMKLTGGRLRVRDTVTNDEKANQLRLYSGEKFIPADEVTAGDICAVTGLRSTRIGDCLGAEKGIPLPVMTPVFTYRVDLPPRCDIVSALRCMRELEEEEPLLHTVYREKVREIHVQLMGEVQLEILANLFKSRYGLEISFGQGSILYRETIRTRAEGVGHYEPLRHYAEVHLLLEPGEPGSGLVFSSACSEDLLDRNWQRLILTHLAEKTQLGVLTGAPITDMKITLLMGRAHLKHTEGGDFRQATYRAVRQGLMQCESVLLEPWYDVQFILPQEYAGRAMKDLSDFGGKAEPPETEGNTAIVRGCAPVRALGRYAAELARYTHGHGHMLTRVRGYFPCGNQEEIIRASGYDPEADLENTPDSVFCAHGAGFNVRWDQVRDYMHVDTEVMDEKPSNEETRTVSRGHAPAGSREEEEELRAIYERTYGPIRRREFEPVRKSAAPLYTEPVYTPPQQEILFVDAYNIIFAWDDLRALSRVSLDDARRALLEILSNYRGVRQNDVIVVFDAYRVTQNAGLSEKYTNLTLVYTKEGQTADSYIEKEAHRLAGAARMRVATSDGAEQMMIMGSGALRVSAGEFRREVEAAQIEIRTILERNEKRLMPSRDVEHALRRALAEKENRKV